VVPASAAPMEATPSAQLVRRLEAGEQPAVI
jgi:hypothetical protein